MFVVACAAFPLALLGFVGINPASAALGLVLVPASMWVGRRAARRYRDRGEPLVMDYLFE